MAETEIDVTGNSLPSTPSPQPAPSEQEVASSEDKPTSDSKPIYQARKVDLTEKVRDLDTDALLDVIVSQQPTDLLPWEEVVLPSKGVYYGDAVPGGVVRVRAMGTYADKILATQRLAQSGQSIDYLFQHCVQFPGDFSPLDLLAGDRVFLLYVLRGITHDNNYEFMMKCPHCEATNSYAYDLNNLASTVTGPDPSIGDEPFRVDLPYMSAMTGREIFVNVRFLRGRDITAMGQRQRFVKKIAPGKVTNSGKPQPRGQRAVTQVDDTLVQNLNMLILGFCGKQVDPDKIAALVERMHSQDTATIREFIKNKSPGIDTTVEFQCKDCDGQIRTELPITESFFRPTNARTNRS
jgi:hypothetical protein